MLSKLSTLLHSRARGWLILALIAAFVAFVAVTLPRLQAAPGGNIVSLDAQLFYTPEQAFSTVAAYGDARRFWIPVYMTWDVINPILYTSIFGLLISWLFRRSFKPESRLQKLNVLPVGAGLCDLLENTCIVTLLAIYPVQPAAVAWLSTVCTVSKMVFLSVSMLLILVGLVATAIKALSRTRVKKTLLAAALLLFMGAVCHRLATHEIVRCYLVRWSDLDNIAPGIYVDPDMPESQRQILLSSLADAKARVATLYGEYTANPVIIAGHTMDVMKSYGGSSNNRAGRAYLTPVASFIILGPNGVSNMEDVLPHELAHVEFSVRIGHWNRGQIPVWFDEGLAVQFDDRYSEAEWQIRTDNGRTAPDLDQIGIITHSDWLKYATAKHEVSCWLDVVGQEGFLAFLQSIRSGGEFQETYHSIERAKE